MAIQKEKQITRKDFLKGVGVSVAGVAMATGVGGLLTACAEKESDPNAGGTGSKTSEPTGSGSVGKPAWPFKYAKLDVEKVKERAFDAYKTKGG